MKIKNLNDKIKEENIESMLATLNTYIENENLEFNEYEIYYILYYSIKNKQFDMAKKFLDREDLNLSKVQVPRILYDMISNDADKSLIYQLMGRKDFHMHDVPDFSQSNSFVTVTTHFDHYHILDSAFERNEKEDFTDVINMLLDRKDLKSFYLDTILEKADKLEDKTIFNKLAKRGDVAVAVARSSNAKLLDKVLSTKGLDINYEDGIIIEEALKNIEDKKVLKKLIKYPGVDLTKIDFSNEFEFLCDIQKWKAANFILGNIDVNLQSMEEKLFDDFSYKKLDYELISNLVDRKDIDLSKVSRLNLENVVAPIIRDKQNDLAQKIFTNKNLSNHEEYDFFMNNMLYNMVIDKNEKMAKDMLLKNNFNIDKFIQSLYLKEYREYMKETGIEELISQKLKEQEEQATDSLEDEKE